MIIAIDINTELWYNIIDILKKDGWKVVISYFNFDKGIDFDFYVLKKENEEIILGWDNWMEGEIKCEENIMKQIEQMMGIEFKKGEPVNLKPEVIALYKKD